MDAWCAVELHLQLYLVDSNHRRIADIGHTKGVKNQLTTQIGHLEKRLRNGCSKRQVTLVVSHKARP
jgi:hypothetical protein